jgi:F420H(2)-dependent quinone reductase
MGKLFFRFINRIHIFLYRLTGGRFMGKVQGLRVLLLTTTGRKSGEVRTTPLGYFEQDGDYIIIASNAGFDSHPAWFHNLRSNLRTSIEVNDKKIEVIAEISGQDQRGQLWGRLIQLSPGYANYAKKTKREIPVVILHPEKG